MAAVIAHNIQVEVKEEVVMGLLSNKKNELLQPELHTDSLRNNFTHSIHAWMSADD